jgi:hypothetical protein
VEVWQVTALGGAVLYIAKGQKYVGIRHSKYVIPRIFEIFLENYFFCSKYVIPRIFEIVLENYFFALG